MTAFVIVRETPNRVNLPAIPRPPFHPKMVLNNIDHRNSFTLRYAPKSVTYGGAAPSYLTTQRPGRIALVQRNYDALPTVTFEAFFGAPDLHHSVEPEVGALKTFAALPGPLTVQFNPSAGGYWYITDLSYVSSELQHGTNAIVRATVNVTLTRAADVAAVGPVSGGHAPGGRASPRSGAAQPPKRRTAAPRTHVVRAGETLSGIAATFLSDSSRWGELAHLNGIRDPRNVPIGTTLRLPR